MNIRTIPVEKINPAAYNPRIDLQPGDPEYNALKKSIEQFGYIDPLIWNEKTGNLVGGHQRYKILMEESPKEITVSVVSLDENKEKALNVALNKISGNWDEDKLSVLLEELSNEGEIDLALTGFSDVDLKRMLGDIEIPNFEEGSEEDQGDLGVLSSKLVICPHCGEEFERD
ncbi:MULTISPECIES: ParB N-terminal domain-containing protein [Bacillus subtilis group]|uniref:ParB N-terminal domain-containing protein n=1 Tax=Bacillus subtilis group TaxID=653685 RepID=UPI0002897B77|nr:MULTISPECIES: ParB N-terminal domain-containing protein [Bacillus subtilis group]MBG9768856.1 transcriptional regulator [Bacillus vallismortis]MED4559629.1 ParB N-terminal domain-containing protein [Bacillus subtilis]QAV10287.1 transcriptional regulator [Bacillus vallismortis]